MKLLSIALMGSVLVLQACGGSSSGNSSADVEVTSSGRFVDASVANIAYSRNGVSSGVTGSNGEFDYLVGETIVFSIGDLNLPPVIMTTNNEIVTPLTLAGTTDTRNQTVVNIIRLLQSLDDASDDVIFISDTTVGAFSGSAVDAIDFEVSTADFESNTDLTSVLSAAGITSGLINEATAIAAFEGELAANSIPFGSLEGSWLFEGDEFVVLTITSDNRFIWAEADGEAPNGLEAGEYQLSNGSLTFDANIIDNNGDGGVDGLTATDVEVNNNTLSFVLAEDGVVTATRVISSSDENQGSWLFEGDDFVVLTLLSESRFMWAEVDGEEPNGLEAGTYTLVEGSLTFDANIIDNNDDGGVDGLTATDLTVNDDNLSFNLAEDGVVSASRIGK
ncbi:MAG: hypothetical protein VB958_13745 [Thalassolituus sp.]|uniref:hypothetical protein n=1 Tax=Thalassolituus sp. TaxID=2030822 RepID=UPI003981FA11